MTKRNIIDNTSDVIDPATKAAFTGTDSVDAIGGDNLDAPLTKEGVEQLAAELGIKLDDVEATDDQGEDTLGEDGDDEVDNDFDMAG